jgi:transposase
VSMTGNINRVEVITSVQRRRRWSAEEKARIVQETYAPGMSVSLVARQHGIAPNQVFTWRRLYAEGALSAIGAGEEVVATARGSALLLVRALQQRASAQSAGLSLAPRVQETDPRESDRGRGRRSASTA